MSFLNLYRSFTRKTVGLIIASIFFTAITAQAEHAFVTGGYQEAVFSVSDIEAMSAFFQDVGGWQEIYRGEGDPQLNPKWGLKTGVRRHEVLLANPGTSRGFLRLIRFDAIEQVQIRSNAQSWDTGGFFDVNVRVTDMVQKFDQLQSRHWQSVSDPVQFSFGPFTVKEWLARGPDGIVVAMIERVAPPLEGWPQLRDFSRLFNATQVVSDAELARSFYEDKLDFQVYLESHRASAQAGPNVLGLPYNLTTEIPRHVYIVHPDGTNEGSIEILAFEGATGSDFSPRATPPNLGILMLRFPVRNIDDFFRHLLERKVDVRYGPTPLELPPYGKADLLAIKGPGNVWIEFFELHVKNRRADEAPP